MHLTHVELEAHSASPFKSNGLGAVHLLLLPFLGGLHMPADYLVPHCASYFSLILIESPSDHHDIL